MCKCLHNDHYMKKKIIQIKAHCSSVVIFLVSNPRPSITTAHDDLFVPAGDRAIRLSIGKFSEPWLSSHDVDRHQ